MNNNNGRQRPRVFMLQPHKVDISPAFEYGQVRFIFKKGENRPSIWSDDFVEEVLNRLEDEEFNPQVDFLLAAGNFVPVVRAFAAIAKRYTPTPKVLFYDAVQARYLPLRLVSCSI